LSITIEKKRIFLILNIDATKKPIYYRVYYKHEIVCKTHKEKREHKMNFEKIMSPLKIGGMTIRNRLIMPAMGSNLAEEDGSINDRIYSYYVERAKGGFGLVIVEVCSIDEMGYSIAHEPAIWDDKFLPGLTRLAKGVHEYGGKICLQLHHAGRDAGSPVQPVAPSSIKMSSSPHFHSRQPRELTTAEVWELIEKFGNAAVRAQKAGADAVEIHSAHQYLVAQFSSPFTNKRTDEFGGSFENRMRFAVEIIKNIRKKKATIFLY
jgi:2,4-dienoyl-CoA reductase-like NADH-dependent reductase (Old Yellow Enzyme family)